MRDIGMSREEFDRNNERASALLRRCGEIESGYRWGSRDPRYQTVNARSAYLQGYLGNLSDSGVKPWLLKDGNFHPREDVWAARTVSRDFEIVEGGATVTHYTPTISAFVGRGYRFALTLEQARRLWVQIGDELVAAEADPMPEFNDDYPPDYL